jgi:hypothetical protein
MSKKTKALLYNLIAFAALFIPIRYLILEHYLITPILKPIIAFVIATLLAPKFQAGNAGGTEKIFMRWIFLKGVKEVK